MRESRNLLNNTLAYLVGMLEKHIVCVDLIARHNIDSTLSQEYVPTQKIRKFCCA